MRWLHVLMAHRQWMPVARALWYSLKATHLMHTRGCLCRNAWVAMQVKIGFGHLFTLPIQQLKLYNIWFLNMEHPSHKIMWWMWFQLAHTLLCTKNVYWDGGNFTYVYFHYPCHCVLACWQTSMVANGIGIMYVTNIVRQRLCKLYHKPQKLFSRKSLWDLCRNA